MPALITTILVSTQRRRAAILDSPYYPLHIGVGPVSLNKGTAEGLQDAIEHFEEATSRDSTYAVAYAGLAVALDLADHFRVFPGKQAFPRAKAAAIKIEN